MNLHHTTWDRIMENGPRRKPGYMEECLRIGKKSGPFIEFTTEQFHYLAKKYALRCISPGRDVALRRPGPDGPATVAKAMMAEAVRPYHGKTKIIHGSRESRLSAPASAAAGPPKIGLGDRLHEVLGPVGKAIHWPCMKGDGTTDLKPKSLCGHLRQTLNIIKT